VSEIPKACLADLVKSLDHLRRPVRSQDREPGPFPYYGASGIVDYVSNYLFEGLHLLIAEDGENLRTRKTPIAFLANGRFWVNNHAHVVQANEIADTRYLSYAVEATDISGYLTGSTQPKLTKDSMLKLVVPAPSRDEQRAIAGVLGALDDKIESNRRLARVAQDLARSELEHVCADSNCRVAVRDVVRSVRERIRSEDPMFPYIGLEHFSGFDLALWRYGRAADTTSAAKVCEAGDLVFGRIRPYFGNVALAGQAAVVAHSIEVLRPIHENDLEAVFLRLSSREFIDAATTISSGTTMPQVKWTDLEAEEIVIPTPDRMIQFRKAVAPLFELLKRLPSEVESLASIRNSLLPELLSGRLQVRNAEKVVEGVL